MTRATDPLSAYRRERLRYLRLRLIPPCTWTSSFSVRRMGCAVDLDFFSVFFAVVLLGESLHTLEIAGGVLIFAGIAYERLWRRRAARSAELRAPA